MNGDDLKMINQKNGFIIESYESNSKMNENIDKSIEAMSDILSRYLPRVDKRIIDVRKNVRYNNGERR